MQDEAELDSPEANGTKLRLEPSSRPQAKAGGGIAMMVQSTTFGDPSLRSG